MKSLLQLFFLFLSFSPHSLAINTFEGASNVQTPTLTSPVVDEANLLTSTEQKQLVNQIKSIHRQNGPKIQIITVDNLQGLTIEDFSIKLLEQWRTQNQNLSNGVIITVAKKERATRIEVGKEIKSKLTDHKTFEIINKLMLVEFKNGRFHAGLQNAIWAIASEFNISAATGSEFKNLIKHRAKARGVGKFNFNIAILISFVLLGLVSKFVHNSFTNFMLSGLSTAMVFHILIQMPLFTILAALLGSCFGLRVFFNQKISHMGYRKSIGHFGTGGFSGGASSGSW